MSSREAIPPRVFALLVRVPHWHRRRRKVPKPNCANARAMEPLKKPLSAYMLFASATRATLKAERPGSFPARDRGPSAHAALTPATPPPFPHRREAGRGHRWEGGGRPLERA